MITASDKTAEWAREPIARGPGAEIEPLVVGPRGVPVITDPARAKQDPELAVLSVMAHGHGDVETAVQIALSAAVAATPLDEDTRVLYFDLIEAASARQHERHSSISEEVRQRAQGSTDLEQLRHWIRRSAVISSADELFDQEPIAVDTIAAALAP